MKANKILALLLLAILTISVLPARDLSVEDALDLARCRMQGWNWTLSRDRAKMRGEPSSHR